MTPLASLNVSGKTLIIGSRRQDVCSSVAEKLTLPRCLYLTETFMNHGFITPLSRDNLTLSCSLHLTSLAFVVSYITTLFIIIATHSLTHSLEQEPHIMVRLIMHYHHSVLHEQSFAAPQPFHSSITRRP